MFDFSVNSQIRTNYPGGPEKYDLEIIKRVASIISYGPRVEWEPDNQRWRLDDSNNWWMRKKGEDRFSLDYRYLTHQKMEALQIVIIWLLGLEDWN